VGKLLSWVAIAFAIYIAYKIVLALQRKAHLRDSSPRGDPTNDVRPSSDRENAKQLTTLIACARCGLQLPQDEAVSDQGVFFCGESHARLGIKTGGDA
jgi:uncharacterized protein